MKKIMRTATMIMMALFFVFSFVACGNKTVTEQSSESIQAEMTAPASLTEVEKTGLWENATYLSDIEFGHGAKTAVVEVTAEEQSVTFTVHTDKDTVGEALLENELIAGDEGDYGLYVKSVNGMLADYDVDQSYWAFYIDGEYAEAGVDTTEITEEAEYQLAYTK